MCRYCTAAASRICKPKKSDSSSVTVAAQGEFEWRSSSHLSITINAVIQSWRHFVQVSFHVRGVVNFVKVKTMPSDVILQSVEPLRQGSFNFWWGLA
jgi:hypothetical protein